MHAAERKRRQFRMPAEWEPHEATWVSWPHRESSWPGRLQQILPVYAGMIAALSRTELVRINVNSAAMAAEARELLQSCGPLGCVEFHQFPTDDAWCRDHGAIFVRDTAAEPGHDRVALDFRFNAWGGKYPPWELDDLVAARMAEVLDVPCQRIDVVLEGGSIDVNGEGLLLTTESCLLNPNRNPQLSRDDLNELLGKYLGATQVLWLKDGIVGDDTDGHIDDLARFVSKRTVVIVREPNTADENYELLEANVELLQRLAEQVAGGLEIVELPMPEPVVWDGQRLPASYANFYIGNQCVLLPTFDCPQDGEALACLSGLFPDREVIPINCRDIVWGLGACHCLTQQVPTA